MRRLLLALLATTALASLSVGSATSMRVSSDNLTSGNARDWGVANASAVREVCNVGDLKVVPLRVTDDPRRSHAVAVAGGVAACALTAVHIEIHDEDGVFTRARGVLDGTDEQVFVFDQQVALNAIVAIDLKDLR